MTEQITNEQQWDEKYSESDRVWSGEPNGAMVDEASALQPGRVLDVGCGEGADAIWLALHGWDVTALDVSGVALRRAQQAAREAGATVHWLHAGLLDANLPKAGFDLVIALYPALLRTPDHGAEAALLNSVAVDGTLLFVHHDVFGTPPAGSTVPPLADAESHGPGHNHGPGSSHGQPAEGGHRFTPADMVGVEDMRIYLAGRTAEWQIETHEVRDRRVSGGAGAHHSQDVILRARRLG